MKVNNLYFAIKSIDDLNKQLVIKSKLDVLDRVILLDSIADIKNNIIIEKSKWTIECNEVILHIYNIDTYKLYMYMIENGFKYSTSLVENNNGYHFDIGICDDD